MARRLNDPKVLHTTRPARFASISRIAIAMSGLTFAACSDPPIDLAGSAPLDCAGAVVTRTLRIDRLGVPINGDDPQLFGADLDGDGGVDNQAGGVLNFAYVYYPSLFESEPPRVQRRLDSDLVWLVEIEQCAGDARVTLARGETTATGVRIVEEGELAAGGPSIDGHIDAIEGIGLLPLGPIFDLGDIGATTWQATFPANVELDLSAAEATGRLTGGASPGYRSIIIDVIQPYLQMWLDDGIPGWEDDTDTDGDGLLSTAELENSPLISNLVRADLDVGADQLDPPSRPPLDGTPESYSFGFSFHAVDVDVE
jgi:hypothetical protein